MNETGSPAVLRFLTDLVPDLAQTGDIGSQLLGAGMEGGGPHDHAVSLGTHLVDHFSESGPVVVRQPAADPDAVRVGHQDEVAPGERRHPGQSGPLGTHRILRHLDQDVIALLEDVLDPAVGPTVALPIGGDVRCIENAVLGGAEVEECRLHTGEDVANLGQVDVPCHRCRRLHERRSARRGQGLRGSPSVSGPGAP